MATNSSSKPAVTIYEIAAHVGVSPAAVSSVLANRHVERRLAATTVEKVRAAALSLGYVPNMAGRRLRARGSSTRQFYLAILTSFEAPLPLVSQVLRKLQRAVDARATENTSYTVVIDMFHAGRLREKPGLLDSDRYHGVVITNTLPADDEFLAGVQLPYPAVIMGRRLANHHCVLETPDYVGMHSADVLIGAGCRFPAVLHGKMLSQAISGRVSAFSGVIQEKLGQAATTLVSKGLEPSSAAEVVERFLKEDGQIDGLFTVTDSLAVGAYQAIKRSGRRIPGDVAVVGVGDYELAEFFDPPMSTVAGTNEAMVEEVIPLLFRLLKGDTLAPREVLVAPPICLRESTKRRDSVPNTGTAEGESPRRL